MRSHERIKLDPARTVLKLFSTSDASGCSIIAGLVERDYSSVYRWQYSKEDGGTDGFIPSEHLPKIKLEARRRRISLPYKVLIGLDRIEASHA